MPSDPPSWRASRAWEPDHQPTMAFAGPKTPFISTRLSSVVCKRVSGYNIFRALCARYVIIH